MNFFIEKLVSIKQVSIDLQYAMIGTHFVNISWFENF